MKAIIFDCDGTLVDSEMAHYSAWSYALKKQGFTLSMEEYSHCVGQPIDKTSQKLAHKIGKDCAGELKRDKHAFYFSLMQKGVSPIKDTFAFLHQLVNEQKRFNYKFAIASGASREEIAIYLRHLKIAPIFEVVLSGKDDLSHYSDPEGVNKPKPYIYLEAAKRLGVAPAECIAVEDSYIGVMASVKAGCMTVAVPTSFSINHDFSAAHLIISSFNNYTVNQFLRDVSATSVSRY